MTDFFVTIIVMLASARILGEIFRRLNLPSLIGEILAGIIIGPSLFNIIQISDSLTIITNLAVFFMMFLTGLELHPQEILRASKKAFIVSIAAFVIPFIAGAAVAHLFGLSEVTSLFVGLTLAITAVPVNSIVLMEFGMLKTKIGTTVITAGVINDILSLIVLGIIVQLSTGSSHVLDYSQIGFSIFTIVAFLGLMSLLGIIFSQASEKIRQRFSPLLNRLRTKESSFGIMLISAIGVSLVAQYVGLHFAIGAFFAGLIVYKKVIGKTNYERVNDVVSAITFGLLAPLFFVFIGLEVNIHSITNSMLFFVALLAVAIFGKIGGGFIGTKVTGFSNPESKIISYLMNSRGMVELVIAAIGLQLKIIDLTLFSVLVIIGFITTIMAPIMARRSLHALRVDHDDAPEKFG